MAFKNNFIIALGGTGGAALKAFREVTVERKEEHDALLKDRRRFQYLYIDTNDADIDQAIAWSHQGEDISLVQGTEALSIALPPNRTVAGACALPNVLPWIGRTTSMESDGEIAEGTIQGAGQRRRYGRLLAASSAAAIRQRIDAGMTTLAEGLTDRDRRVTFHVFATLGGGTGSGSIVDVLTLIPELCRARNLHCKVVAYLFVGAGGVGTQNTGFFYQNEYAALRDINALMANRYRPFRAFLNNPNKPFHDKADPIDAVYISTEENGVLLDAQVKRFAAACFDLISFVPSADSAAARAFSGEDIYASNPGEKSIVERNPHTGRDVVTQHYERDYAGHDKLERSYRFQTLSTVRAKHPMKELRGILATSLGAVVIERWINGDILNRSERDKSVQANLDIFQYNQTDTVIIDELGTAYTNARLKDYDARVEALLDEGISETTLGKVQKMTEELCTKILADATTEVQPVPGQETGVERICRKQAIADRSNIIARLESRRQWAAGARPVGSVWGIRDMIEYLNNVRQELEKKGISGVDQIPEDLFKNARARVREWRKMGILTQKATPKPSAMFEYQKVECRGLVETACQLRIDAIRRVRNSMLRQMLNDDINFYNQAVAELEAQSQGLLQQKAQHRVRLGTSDVTVQNPELHDLDDSVSVWSEANLTRHEEFYLDNARCSEEVILAMIACETRFTQIAERALDLVQHVAGRTTSRAKALVDDINRKMQGALWAESARIHDVLCQRVGQDRYPLAYAPTIYDYLADKDTQYRTTLHDMLMRKVASSAAVTPSEHGGPTQRDTDIEEGPWRAACLGMLPVGLLLNANAIEAHGEMNRRLSASLSGRANTGRFRGYEHSDGTEIRIAYTEYYMPLRFFRVTEYLEERYNVTSRASGGRNTGAAYFPNIDEDGMLDPCPDRPDLLPVLNPARFVERNEAAKNQKQQRVSGDLYDDGEWEPTLRVKSEKNKAATEDEY
ncbi:MAG: hypothetical protein E7032_08110 [Akkermansiaceae bacterium]|nr:hypothetical protein [Akkermansiaceae bacterium]